MKQASGWGGGLCISSSGPSCGPRACDAGCVVVVSRVCREGGADVGAIIFHDRINEVWGHGVWQ
jgi:hypothetical protein